MNKRVRGRALVERRQLEAQVARALGRATGSSAARRGYAVIVFVPERRPVLLMGAWPADTSERERDFANVVRGVVSCQGDDLRCLPSGH